MPPSPSRPPGVTRVVALGASNLTLGIETVLSTARGAWGADIEVLAALGYGRSYGALSRIAGRTLPGILESGLWAELKRLPDTPTLGIITDVGNDILYGFLPAQIVAWVEEAADRLRAYTPDVVITSLPTHNVGRLSSAKFLFFRSLFFPPSRVTRDQAFERVAEVNLGLAGLAASKGLRFVNLRPEWYGVDPIHLRPRVWRTAWREILMGEGTVGGATRFSGLEWARLHTFPPERRWWFGIEQATPQSGRRLRRGGRLWLY
ncbi:MAG: SGNH/GDSL hydrolase family protein [Vicinamibacteria bacterium]